MAPISPYTAERLPVDDAAHDPLAEYLADVYTVPVSLAGLPSVALPCARPAGSLPVGLQIVGPRHAEVRALRTAFHLHAALHASHAQ
mmetsp:Transcript_5015/g.12507  ORF Transcript_5015/g.12507 Transcript_5015/m.12507 type:complete len:87 (+) Transcript_5015:106-366(+)